MDNALEKIIDDGINIFWDIVKELIEYFTPNVDLNDIQDKSLYVERMAKFGWTKCYQIMEGYGENDLYNQEEIDDYFFQKFTEDDKDWVLDFYIDIISAHSKVEAELYEAKQCYKNEEFRGCAMIVTSLIDKLLILDQKEFLQDNDIIKTGWRATKTIFRKIGDYNVIEMGEERYLALISISKFLEVFFECTNNFENDKKTINRNMLMHGMWTNDITQIDCMKLFIALVNMVMTIEMYLSIKF